MHQFVLPECYSADLALPITLVLERERYSESGWCEKRVLVFWMTKGTMIRNPQTTMLLPPQAIMSPAIPGDDALATPGDSSPAIPDDIAPAIRCSDDQGIPGNEVRSSKAMTPERSHVINLNAPVPPSDVAMVQRLQSMGYKNSRH